ncbi:hypothetical protein [Phyllobacterium leguminum]|uniref:Uncharacterized protein n=1 Tax=Phyllobacterium leguminum TaxID=314237 RepID=A0A318SRA8_9HYPH|nr:hypothetical protein [Phyllobacterium leguminum]PYE84203.1 hypothetical protein C7477_1493 [Phyllobacterium leguminum]
MNPKWKSISLAGLMSVSASFSVLAAEKQSGGPQAVNQGNDAATESALEAWGWKMAGITPPYANCWRVTYPSTVWTKCDPFPTKPRIPPRADATKDDRLVFYLETPAPVTQAVASFPFVAGATQAVTNGGGGDVPGAYSIQMNTNSANGMWQQFAYQTGGSGVDGFLSIWYWTKDWNGVSYLVSVPGSGDYSVSEFLNTMKMYAFTGRSNSDGSQILDGVLMQLGDTISANIYSTDGAFDISPYWTSTEFNVLGFANGLNLTFSADTTLTAEVGALYAGYQEKQPQCEKTGTSTAETNNLYLGSCTALPYYPADKPYPYISFTQTNDFTQPPPPTVGNPRNGATYSISQVPAVSGNGMADGWAYPTLDGQPFCVSRISGDSSWVCPTLNISPGKHTMSVTQTYNKQKSPPATINFTVTQ